MKLIRIVLIILYVLISIACLAALYFCISTVVTTIVVYSLVGFMAIGLLRLFRKLSLLNRTWYLNLKTACLSLLLTLFAGEMVLRYVVGMHKSYPEQNGSAVYYSLYHFSRLKCLHKQLFYGLDCRYHTPPPNTFQTVEKSEFIYNHYYNELGLRDDSLYTKHADSTFTIITIGDSFTEGEGTHQDSTWTRQLQRLLEMEGKENISTINGGAMGSDPIGSYVLFSEQLVYYDPELVILAINSTDIDDLILRGGIERVANPTTVIEGPWWEYIYAFSYVFRAIINSYQDLNYHNLPADVHEKKKAGAIHDLGEVVNLFQDLSEQRGFRFMVVIHPLYDEFEEENMEVRQVYREIRENTSVPVIYLLDEYKAYGITPANVMDYYWSTDMHHNTRGYMVWSEIMKEKVIDLVP